MGGGAVSANGAATAGGGSGGSGGSGGGDDGGGGGGGEGFVYTSPDDVYVSIHTTTQQRRTKVVSLSFCPTGRYYVTGAEDGLSRVWRARPDCSSGSSKAGAGRLASLTRTAQREMKEWHQEPVLKLTGHLDGVTHVEYNRSGTRILTCSDRDGTARIFQWIGDYELDSTQCQILQHRTPCGTGGKRGPSRRKKKNDAVVDTCAWSCDDSMVFTAQSTPPPTQYHGDTEEVGWRQRINVWNSDSGEKVHCLLGHEHQACVLLGHPHDARILLSAGYDGLVIL